ncbi:hypothetical protein [Immundisolibacter sp.]|uniref:hypothetical protein n=1 Tax=Immundisolibacter sp. TaxID=1934948 RepID=UPI003F8295C2
MATLLEQLAALAEGDGLQGDIAVQAGQFSGIASGLQGLIDEPPAALASLLGQLEELPLPRFEPAARLQADLGGIATQLGSALADGAAEPAALLGDLGTTLTADIGVALAPVLRVIDALRVLLGTDLSCGLVPGLTPPAPGEGAAPPPAPAGGAAGDTAAAAPPLVGPAEVAAAQALVDTLPADMSVSALTHWLHARIGTFRPSYIPLRAIPLVDDLRDPLDTLVRWDLAPGSALRDELADTLQRLAQQVDAHGRQIVEHTLAPGRVAPLPIAGVTAAHDLAAAVEALAGAAVAGGEPDIAAALATASGAQAALSAAADALEGHGAALVALRADLRAVPSVLEGGINRLSVLLTPSASFDTLADAFGVRLPDALDDEAFAPLVDVLTATRQFLERILAAVDIDAVSGPVTEALATAQDTLVRVDGSIAQLTAQVRAAFDQAQDALAAIDPEALLAQAREALEQLIAQAQAAVDVALAPVAGALTDAIDTAQGVLGGFDPEALAAPLTVALEQLAALLASEPVQALIRQLDALRAVAERLDGLRFEPVTGAVVEAIGDVESTLRSIDEASLVAPLPDMLAAAMAVLPPTLTPLITPLRSTLQDMVDAGPREVLQAVRDLPGQIESALLAYAPRALLEQPLGTPYAALVDALDDFSPTAWLDQADDALAGVRERLAGAIDPAAVLAPLREAHGALQAQVQALRPGAVLAPLTQQIDGLLGELDAALPTEDLADALTQAVEQLRRLLAPLGEVQPLIDTLTARLALLTDPEAQMAAWLDGILGKLPDDIAPVEAAAQTLRDAVSATTSARLADAWQALRSPLAAALDAVDPAATLARLNGARATLTTALAAAPPSAARTAALDWLADFDPLGEDGRSLRELAALRDALHAADTALAGLWPQWDARYHRADGPLATLLPEPLDAAALRSVLRDAALRQFGAPLVGLLRLVRTLGVLLARAGDGMSDLVNAVGARLDALLAAPQALADLAQSLDALVDRLTGLDLDVYAREVDALHTALLSRLRALSPDQLAQALAQEIETLLGNLSLGSLTGTPLRATLDDAWAGLRARLAALDPEPLVIAPLQASYEADLLPLVRAFDIREAVDAVLARLDGLPDELGDQLQQVDRAYQAMLAAAPSGRPAAAAGSVSF